MMFIYTNENLISDDMDEVGYVTERDGKNYASQYSGIAHHHGVIDSHIKWEFNDNTSSRLLPVTYTNKIATSTSNKKPYEAYDLVERQHSGTSWMTHLNPQNDNRAVGMDLVEFICRTTDKKEVIIDKNELITENIADRIINSGIEQVEIRTVLTCRTDHGVCCKCYGRNLATGNIVEIGEAVGTMGAQSIGEPGTQLTMRTFHTGGVAGGEDITQGLPRVEELFEARIPKGKATIAEIDGTISKIEDQKGRTRIYIQNDNEVREHLTAYGAKIRVEKGDKVSAGDRLTEGNVSPKELLAVTDPNTVQQYILREVQKVYRSQGVDINDKHVELIARRMISQIRIMDSGDTNFLPSTVVSINKFTEGNRDVILQGKKPAIGQPILLGITKSSLQTDSFLASASFQETTRILTEAAVKGNVDHLHGLKENVIIGKLIPAGTGAKEYMDIGFSLEKEFFDDEPAEVLEEEFLD